MPFLLRHLTLEPNGYSLALLGVALIAGALAVVSWSRRPAPAARWLVWTMAAVFVWSAGYAMELASVQLAGMLFWVRLEYLGIATLPVAWLLFALQYAGYERWLTRRCIALLLVIPVCTILLNYTNAWHSLYYSQVGVDYSGPFPMLALQKGPWYWVYAAYGYAVTLTGSMVLLRYVINSPNLYRRQVWALVLAALAPAAGNVLYQLGQTPVTSLDVTPFAFAVTGLVTAWSLGYFQLLDVTPLARDSLIETLHDGMLVVDAQGRIIDLNPAAQRYLALDERAVGRAASGVLARWPELADFCTRQHEAQAELTLDQGDFEVQTSPLANGRGRFIGSVVVLRDITARKEAEAAEHARQVAEASYRAIRRIVDTVKEGLVLLDPDRQVVMANAVGQAHLARLASLGENGTVDALGGRSLAELMQLPEGLPFHRLLLEGPPLSTFEVALHPLPPAELPGGWVLATRDVTQAHQLQQRMEQQERLAAVGQLAAGIAHDFNNVLSVILLYTGLLQRSPNLLPKQRAQLDILDRQAHHANHLVQQILDFSRKAIIEIRQLDLVYFLRDLAELCRRTLPETIQVELEIPPGPVHVCGDVLRLQAALLNLVFNARDAMPAGGTLGLHLTCRQVDEGQPLPLPELTPGAWAVVKVSDTGTGIDPAAQEHLFEPFFTTKEPGHGSGLGLAQVFGIVKQHRGVIGVESQVGAGTTLTLYLPLAVQEEAAAPG